MSAARERNLRLALVVGFAALALAVDLWTKAWVWLELRPRPHPPRVVIPGLLQLQYALNTGAALGIGREQSWSRPLLVAIAIVTVAFVVRLAWRWPDRGRMASIAIGLVVGGALGNLHDRLVRGVLVPGEGVRHGVVDFIVVFWAPGRAWPAFNVADIVLTVGFVLMAAALLRLRRTRGR